MRKIKRTLREKKFVKAYVENGGNAMKAYLAVNPNCKGNSAYELGSRMLRKVEISDKEILEEIGINDAYLMRKIKEGIEATKVVSVIPIPPKREEAGTGYLPKADSKSVEFIDVEDYPTRHKYIDMMLKLRSKYPAEKHEHEIKIPDVVEVVHYVQQGNPPEVIEEREEQYLNEHKALPK